MMIGPIELLLVLILVLIPALAVVWIVKWVISARRERTRLRLEVGKLADEVQQLREEQESKS
jgi:cell division protein FtsL